MTNELPAYRFFDPQTLREIADNEEDIILEIINEFISSSPVYIGDIEVALSVADLKKITFIAHKLKGALKFIGATQPAEIAQEIEYLAANDATAVHKIHALLTNLSKDIEIVAEEVTDYRNHHLDI